MNADKQLCGANFISCGDHTGINEGHYSNCYPHDSLVAALASAKRAFESHKCPVSVWRPLAPITDRERILVSKGEFELVGNHTGPTSPMA